MKNRVGLIIFGAGFLGICIFGMGLDSPGEGWKIALSGVAISTLVGALGYSLMNVSEVLNGVGFERTKDSRAVQMRKLQNREKVWSFWLSTK